jgi:hypothetical protein
MLQLGAKCEIDLFTAQKQRTSYVHARTVYYSRFALRNLARPCTAESELLACSPFVHVCSPLFTIKNLAQEFPTHAPAASTMVEKATRHDLKKNINFA